MVRAEGSRTLTGLLSPADFLTDCGFRHADAERRFRDPVCGLDYPFTIPRMIRGLGAARLVSTLSRHIARLGSGLPIRHYLIGLACVPGVAAMRLPAHAKAVESMGPLFGLARP